MGVDPILLIPNFSISSIHSFQSCDRLEDLEGKTSIELLHKRVNLSSVSHTQIFRSPLNIYIYIQYIYINIYILNKMQVLAICNSYLLQRRLPYHLLCTTRGIRLPNINLSLLNSNSHHASYMGLIAHHTCISFTHTQKKPLTHTHHFSAKS